MNIPSTQAVKQTVKPVATNFFGAIGAILVISEVVALLATPVIPVLDSIPAATPILVNLCPAPGDFVHPAGIYLKPQHSVR